MRINKVLDEKINSILLLTEEEEKKLMEVISASRLAGANEEEIAEGISASKRIIEAHLHLVRGVVSSYSNNNVTGDELFSEGVLGLYDALKLFDTNRGCRFSTFAEYKVRYRLRCYALYYNKKDVDSLNVIIDGDGTETSLLNNLCDENSLTPEDVVCSSHMKSLPNKVFARLDEKSTDVLRRHYGFSGDIESFEAIAASYGVSKERIRQIEKNAIKLIRRSPSLMREIEAER